LLEQSKMPGRRRRLAPVGSPRSPRRRARCPRDPRGAL